MISGNAREKAFRERTRQLRKRRDQANDMNMSHVRVALANLRSTYIQKKQASEIEKHDLEIELVTILK